MRCRAPRVATVLTAVAAILVPAATAAATSPLTQLPGAEGCIAQRGEFGCAMGRAMEEVDRPAAISPDGANLYTAATDPAEDLVSSNAIDVLDRDPGTGALTQKPGAEGCLSGNGRVGCARDPLLKGLVDIAISPDGKNVYATVDGGVIAFDRDPTTGALTPIASRAGCIGSPGAKGECQVGVGLVGANDLAFSPDGTELYVTSFEGPTVATLTRDPTTGALSQKPGSAGCVTATAKRLSCSDRRLDSTPLDNIVVSPDGRSAYATTGYEPDGIEVFARRADGTLRHPGGRAGCLSAKGQGGCRPARGLYEAFDLALSPDGRDLYVVSHTQGLGGAVAIFRRSPGGALSQPGGAAGCVSANGGRGGKCRIAKSMSGPYDLAVAPDGAAVYVTNLLGITVLTRSPSGLLTEAPGAAGCVARNHPPCAKARAVETGEGIALSPDGADLYLTTLEPGGIATLRR